MITYICENCNELECETSVCPNCGHRTKINATKIYWSKIFNVPCFDEVCLLSEERCSYIGVELRPVFPEERLLLEILINEPMKFAGKSVWNVGKNNYVIDGKKITINYKELILNNSPENVIERLHEFDEKNSEYSNNYLNSDYIANFIKINKSRLDLITSEAVAYIQKNSQNKSLDEMFVSFSGGKDSTVVSDLVTRALGLPKVIHIYGDTTLEYPESFSYLKRFKNNNKETPMLIAKNLDQEFNNLCEVIGPPSRVMRWCCTVFKTGAITKKIEMTFKDKKKILSFQGIRRNESFSRSKYERESISPKISKQLVVAPIIDWLDFDVWLYILSNRLDFNYAYRQGFSRVGCWCCPNNSAWSEYLSSIYMNTQYVEFKKILYKFAKEVGKIDWENYIDSGNWKARQGGNGLNASKNAIVSFKPCAFDENSYNFELTKPLDSSIYTFFKPFGILDFSIGNKLLNEVYILEKKTKEPILKVTGRIGSSILKITVLKSIKLFKNTNSIENIFKCQVTKYQTCIACGGCQSVCKFNALKVINTKKGSLSDDTISYTIDENKCVGCLECVNHFSGGCYMKKVLRTKKGEQ